MVKIRLTRLGRKNYPCYRLILVDSRKKRDGTNLQLLGTFNPFSKKLVLNEAQILDALAKGAQPSETVLNILKQQKIWQKFIASKPTKKKKHRRLSKKALAKKIQKKSVKAKQKEKVSATKPNPTTSKPKNETTNQQPKVASEQPKNNG